MISLLLVIIAAICFALVMLEKHVLGLAGLPLTGAGLFSFMLSIITSNLGLDEHFATVWHKHPHNEG